jgi:hypothetical protein
MLQDLAKYDLLNLIAAEGWDEKEQAKTVLMFSQSLAGFLGERLNQSSPASLEPAFKELLKKPELSPDEVIEFYRQQIPDLDNTLGNLILEFKKIFLTQVYQNKVQELDKQLADPNNKEIETVLKAAKDSWQKSYGFSQTDDWDKVAEAVKLIPR